MGNKGSIEIQATALGCNNCEAKLAGSSSLQVAKYHGNGVALTLRTGVEGKLGSPDLLPALTKNVMVKYFPAPLKQNEVTKLAKMHCEKCSGPVGSVHEYDGAHVVLFKAVDTCWLDAKGNAVIKEWRMSQFKHDELLQKVGVQASATLRRRRAKKKFLQAKSEESIKDTKSSQPSKTNAEAKSEHLELPSRTTLPANTTIESRTAKSTRNSGAELNASRSQAPKMAETEEKGSIVRWFKEREFGFIKPSSGQSAKKNLYFRFEDVQFELSKLHRGAEVSFVRQFKQGRVTASCVQPTSFATSSGVYKKRLTPKGIEKLLLENPEEAAEALVGSNMEGFMNGRSDLTWNEIKQRLAVLDHALCASDSASGYDMRRSLVTSVTDPTQCLILRLQAMEAIVDEIEEGRAAAESTMEMLSMWLRIINTCHRMSPREATEMQPSPKMIGKVLNKLRNALVHESLLGDAELKAGVEVASIFESRSARDCCRDPLVVYEAGRALIRRLQNTATFIHGTVDESASKQSKNSRNTDAVEADGRSKEAPYDLALFRSLDIVPSGKELSEPTQWLRANAAYFRSVNDYMDLQYRLLREDFVKPLREGISAKNGGRAGSGKSDKLFRFQGVVIDGVEKMTFGDRRVRFKLRLNLPQNKRYKSKEYWMLSKKFKYGSLLCLSRHDFDISKPLLFAVIEEAEPSALAMGRLTVSFRGQQQFSDTELFDELNPRHHRVGDKKRYTYSMVESPTYYEAYVHTFSALQRQTESNLPFAHELVQSQSRPLDQSAPEYMRRIAETKSTMETSMFYTGDESKPWTPLADPMPAENCLLDGSQREAVDHVLRNRLAIVQGPPGTGKSFVGTKLIHFLVGNKSTVMETFRGEKMNDPSKDSDGLQILLLGLTNHAVDHLLLSVLDSEITKKIVRVGSRSKNERIQALQLRQGRRRLGAVVSGMRIRESRMLVSTLLGRIKQAFSVLQSTTQIFPEPAQLMIQKVFIAQHLELEQPDLNPIFRKDGTVNKAVLEWLGLRCDVQAAWEEFIEEEVAKEQKKQKQLRQIHEAGQIVEKNKGSDNAFAALEEQEMEERAKEVDREDTGKARENADAKADAKADEGLNEEIGEVGWETVGAEEPDEGYDLLEYVYEAEQAMVYRKQAALASRGNQEELESNAEEVAQEEKPEPEKKSEGNI